MDSQIFWSPGVTLASIEKQVILVAFRNYRGNKEKTAHSLGIAVNTLTSRLKDYQTDDVKEDERIESERRKHSEFLARARGTKTPNNVYGSDFEPKGVASPKPSFGERIIHPPKEEGSTEAGPRTDAGTQLESIAAAPAEQSVPVSERPQVQGVLPQQHAQGSSNRRR